MTDFFRAMVVAALAFSLTFVWMNGLETAVGDMKDLLAMVVATLPG
jgi:hypothetical protein